jgi:glutamine amidotransferase
VNGAAPRIAVVDYGMGNRRSVQKALEHVGADAPITSDIGLLESCAALVIPGVGAFPRGMENLRRLGLAEYLRRRAAEGTPILGICLGMQLLFDSSVELERTEGLGLIPGEVSWLATDGLRLPHIGWNEVRFERPSLLLEGLPQGGCPFYHVHSLAPKPADLQMIVGSAEYGERFATIVARENVSGVQFHPEKSSAHGLRLLANFASNCRAGAAHAPAARPAA